ncbi:MAG: YdcF family protein [Candidatus Aminicenantes bacterium]|nr:YdcF family protein [Candidatus Aminicenantes bacterium]
MFFIKNLVLALILPPRLILLLLIASFVLIYLKKKWGKRLLIAALMLYYCFSISPVSKLLLKGLENKYPVVTTTPQNIKYVAVLGGGAINQFSNLPPTSRLKPSSTTRILEGIRLFNQLEDAYLITSGGGPDKESLEQESCFQMRSLAIMLGVSEERIITTCNSRDTDEEAKDIQGIVGDRPVLLVTSAFHMARSLFLFEKQGINATPAPSDFLAQGKKKYTIHDFLPHPMRLWNSTLAIKEYIGLLYYRILK